MLNATKGTVLGESVAVADTSLSRIVGLLGRTSLEPGEGILIIPCQAVHTIAMRFPIGIVFVDCDCRVLHLHSALAPFRMTRLHWWARCVIELPVGVIARTSTSIGDELLIAD